jgi:hypothetical protein
MQATRVTTMQTATQTTTMSEKRTAPRYRVLKRGTLAFGGGGIDCTVRNLSATGARVDIASPIGVPPNFILVIEADQFIRRCRSVWGNDHQLGVAFE